MARWCDGGRTQRSRRGSLTDTASGQDSQTAGGGGDSGQGEHWRRGHRECSHGDDQVDVVGLRHRMDIAQLGCIRLVESPMD